MDSIADPDTLPSLPEKSPFCAKWIPLEKILALAEKNLSHSQIATILGCSRSAITQRLAAHNYRSGEVQEYRKNRADVFAGLQLRVIASLSDADLQKAPFHSKVIALGILVDKERLERGQSTANVAVVVSAPILERLQAAYQPDQAAE